MTHHRTPTGFWASFKHEEDGKTTYSRLPVQQFTDSGTALVFCREVDPNQLIPADSLDNFNGLHEESHTYTNGRKIIGAVPASDGWFANLDKGDVKRVEAWLVLDNGNLLPVCKEPDLEFGQMLEPELLDPDERYFTIHYQDPSPQK